MRPKLSATRSATRSWRWWRQFARVGKALRLLVKKPALKLKEFNFNDDWNGLPRCIAVPTTAGRAVRWGAVP